MSFPLERPPAFQSVHEPPIVTSPLQTATPVRSGAFFELINALGTRVDQGETLVRRASERPLGRLDAGELIALQAGIYRYAEAVDLTARLVDRASHAVRQVLQSGSH